MQIIQHEEPVRPSFWNVDEWQRGHRYFFWMILCRFCVVFSSQVFSILVSLHQRCKRRRGTDFPWVAHGSAFCNSMHRDCRAIYALIITVANLSHAEINFWVPSEWMSRKISTQQETLLWYEMLHWLKLTWYSCINRHQLCILEWQSQICVVHPEHEHGTSEL